MKNILAVLVLLLAILGGCSASRDVYREGTDARKSIEAQYPNESPIIDTFENYQAWNETWYYYKSNVKYVFVKNDRVVVQNDGDGQFGLDHRSVNIHYRDIIVLRTEAIN